MVPSAGAASGQEPDSWEQKSKPFQLHWAHGGLAGFAQKVSPGPAGGCAGTGSSGTEGCCLPTGFQKRWDKIFPSEGPFSGSRSVALTAGIHPGLGVSAPPSCPWLYGEGTGCQTGTVCLSASSTPPAPCRTGQSCLSQQVRALFRRIFARLIHPGSHAPSHRAVPSRWARRGRSRTKPHAATEEARAVR